MTNKELKALHKKYNKEFFLGALSTPKIKFKKFNKSIEKYGVQYNELMGVCVYDIDCEKIIKIQIAKNLSKYEIICSLLHEMIHQAEWEIFKKEPKHKKLFKKLCKHVSKLTDIPVEDII